MFFEVISHFFVLQSYILHLFYSSFASNLRSPKGANRGKTGCGSPPLGTLSPYYWLSAGSMTFGHSTSGY